MQTPLQAMVWELWRTSRIEMILRVASMCGFVLLIRLVAEDVDTPTVQALRGITVGMLMVTSVFSQTWLGELDSGSSGFSFRLGFVRPVTTRTLVLVPMLFTASAAGICYLLPALLFRIMLNTSIPLLAPAMIVGTSALCITSVVWSSASRTRKAVGLAILAAFVIAAIAGVAMNLDPGTPLLLRLGDPEAFHLSSIEWMILGMIAIAALFATNVAVERQRHGDQLRRRIFSRRSKMPSAKRYTLRPFRNASTAQTWYELRKFGRTVLSLSIAIPLLMVVFLTAVRLVDANWRLDLVVWLGGIFLSPLLYQFVGADGAVGLKMTQGTARLSLFDAARPMHSDRLIMIKLISVTGCSLIGLAIMCAAAAAHTFGTGSNHQWAKIGEVLAAPAAQMDLAWGLVVMCNVVLLCFASTSMLITVGLLLPLHRRWFAGGLIVAAVHVWLFVLDAKTEWAYRAAWEMYAGFLGLAIACLSVVAIQRAIRAGAVTLSLFAPISCLWLVYVGSVVALYRESKPNIQFELPWTVLVLAFALLLVPLASFAIAPLALASHRHR